MSLNTQARQFLSTPAAAGFLSRLYGRGAAAAQAERYAGLAERHASLFGEKDGLRFVSAPGRTEVAGNHTDHNSGRVLAAAVNLDTVAAVTPGDSGIVTLYSAGYDKPFVVDLSDLEPKKSEYETTDGLIRGVAARMKELGYTVLKKDANGQEIDAVDWEKTRAVQIRSNYIYINLKGRDKFGIVEPSEKYALEEQIISDLYSYRDKRTHKRVVGLALRNRDSIALGLGGSECGDIFFTVEEGYNRLHGDGLSTSGGYFGTSVTPVFIASGGG